MAPHIDADSTVSGEHQNFGVEYSVIIHNITGNAGGKGVVFLDGWKEEDPDCKCSPSYPGCIEGKA